MKNTIGTNISVTVFGESHGAAIGAVIDGLPAGFEIDMDILKQDMGKRRAKSALSTQRKEADEVVILSGFFNGKTTGTPLALIIENTNTKSKDYSQLQYRLRPGHADYSAFCKYDGFQDYRGGGHFSGRITAPIVAAGNICRQILAKQGVKIASHIQNLHGLQDETFSLDAVTLQDQMDELNNKDFPVINEEVSLAMQEEILKASSHKDSVGGTLQSVITGMPAGIGEPFFDSAESVLAHMLFSVPAVKGVSFGLGFGFADLYGSQANDPLQQKNGVIITKTNNNGGINGGITNGQNIVINTVVKPTPSIFQEQDSVDYKSKEEVKLVIKGRHDPCIIHRARAVVDCILAIGLLDLWMSKAGTDFFQRENVCR